HAGLASRWHSPVRRRSTRAGRACRRRAGTSSGAGSTGSWSCPTRIPTTRSRHGPSRPAPPTGWPPRSGAPAAERRRAPDLRGRGALRMLRSGRAFLADGAVRALVVELRAVLHEETAHAGELVLLRRQHDDVQLEVGQVGSRQVEARRVVGVLVTGR